MIVADPFGQYGIEFREMRFSPTFDVESAGRNLVGLLEAAREVQGGSESAGQCDFSQRHSRMGHERHRFFETTAFDEVGERRSDERLKDAMKVEGRERCG